MNNNRITVAVTGTIGTIVLAIILYFAFRHVPQKSVTKKVIAPPPKTNIIPTKVAVTEDEDFKPHMMYDPETGEGYKAEKPEDHERMAKLGYVHKKPLSVSKKPMTFDEFCPPLDPRNPDDYKPNLTVFKDPQNECRALFRLSNPMCVYAQDYLVNGYGGLGTALGTDAGVGDNTVCK